MSHHVYSFSEAKTFELALYKGNAHPPLVFDRPGVVVLGCNIHDSMLGYILVVDTPHFASTDAAGALSLDEPAGRRLLLARLDAATAAERCARAADDHSRARTARKPCRSSSKGSSRPISTKAGA